MSEQDLQQVMETERTERDANGQSLGMMYGDPDAGGRGARIFQADGAWVVDLYAPGQPARRFARRRGLVRLRGMATRWARDERRLCRVVVFVDGTRCGSFKALEGSDAARDVEGFLPGWRVTVPVWVVPHDEREVVRFPANRVHVRITEGVAPEPA